MADLGYTQDDLGRLLDPLKALSDRAKADGIAIARQTKACRKSLYHYTDTAALVGMVSNNEIWASDAIFLNDDTELIWSSKILDRVIKSLSPRDAAEASLHERMIVCSDASISGLSFHFASFSENRDELTQWRGYGKGGAPVCVGFNAMRLGYRFPSCELLSVIYDEDEQEDIVKRIVDLCISYYRSNGDSSNPAYHHHYIPHCIDVFKSMFSYASLRFKSPQWRSESEWRLVTASNPFDDTESEVCYRPSYHGLIPYMKLKPHNNFMPEKMPIEEVVTGPTSHRELAARSLYMFLRSKNYGMVDVKPSEVSLRF